MGVDLHITRADHWAENEHAQITSADWLSYVASDPELSFVSKNGRHFARWNGASKYEEPWLDWFNGNISTKWPDTALYEKMLKVAQALGAKVQDDDGTNYFKAGDWIHDPTERIKAYAKQQRAKWWQRLFQRK
jgi:hypothetical protein